MLPKIASTTSNAESTATIDFGRSRSMIFSLAMLPMPLNTSMVNSTTTSA
jgi:hypothetical protein